MLVDQSSETPLGSAEGVRPVPADEQHDTGTPLCPPLDRKSVV